LQLHLINKTSKQVLELEKSKVHIVVEIVHYVPNAVLSKTIVKKITGNITASAFDKGEEMAERISPFDTFIQIIDGNATINIKDKHYHLAIGEGIVIPAHATHSFSAAQQFKMISTVIKSGFEA